MRENDDLDLLIDDALDSYADPGPHSGLEERVLRRLSAAAPATVPLRRWMVWAISLAACLAFAALLHFGFAHTSTHSVRQAGKESLSRHFAAPGSSLIASSPKSPASGGARPLSRVHRDGPGKILPPLPKLDTFPSPQPLTDEEQALVALQNHAPASRQQLLDAQTHLSEPVSIANIEIPPLDPPVQGGN